MNQKELEAQHKKIEQMNKSRIVDGAKPVLFPMLDKKIENLIAQACGELKSGKSDFVSYVAQISALRDIKWELDRIQKQGNRAAEEINNARSTGN